jgi:MFS family permease
MNQWWLVIAGCLAHAVNTGLAYFGMSAYFPSFEKEFGWSRTAISGAFSLARVESGILGPLEGYATDRLGPPRMMFIGIGVSALGFLFLSQVNSLPMLYAVIVLGIVMGSSLGYNMPISVAVAHVFRARRSLAFGIYRMGPGLSGPLVPLVGWMIGLWGWRTAAVASAFILLVIGLPLASLIARVYKEHRGEAEAAPETEAHAASEPLAICMVIYSLAYGGLASLQEPIRADYFGARYFASIHGMSRSITTGGTFLGPLAAGFFYDLTKSYAIPFALFSLISLLSMGCMLLAKPPAKRA